MSSERISTQDDVVYSPRHVTAATNNARNRTRTVSGSSSNQDITAETALLDNDNDDDGVIEGQGYRERVVILTEHEDRDGEEDSGISEATEEHLLVEVDQSRMEPRKETMWHIAIQVFIPFLIAGFGMMTAGLLLDKVQVFQHDHNIGVCVCVYEWGQ